MYSRARRSRRCLMRGDGDSNETLRFGSGFLTLLTGLKGLNFGFDSVPDFSGEARPGTVLPNARGAVDLAKLEGGLGRMGACCKPPKRETVFDLGVCFIGTFEDDRVLDFGVCLVGDLDVDLEGDLEGDSRPLDCRTGVVNGSSSPSGPLAPNKSKGFFKTLCGATEATGGTKNAAESLGR